MKQRVLTAAALLVLLALVVWQIYTPVFIAVIAIFSAIAAGEIMRCAKVSNKFLLVVGVIAAFIVPLFSSESIFEPIIPTYTYLKFMTAVPKSAYVIVVVIAYFLAMLKDYEHTKFEDVAITIVASLLVPSGFAMFGVLRDTTGYGNQIGIYLIFFGLITALGTDVGAQLGGMKFGKTKMSPKISPKKTIEGAVCGIIFGLILNAVAILLYNKLSDFGLTTKQITILLAAEPFIAFLGMMGDLTASVLKRNFDVKDFGKIFPGHGGVMDRFDSSLFTIPLTFVVSIFLVG
ncbi:MAG: phosphatidate cytidylyltransferase [Eubacterium sp.]|nr:phosphatidate cytidylyltransferase [Eubacterium sp.]